MTDPWKQGALEPSAPVPGDHQGPAEAPVGEPGRGAPPGTRSYLVLDPQKLTTEEIAEAIMAMVDASRNRGK